MAFYTNSIPK